MTIEEKDSFGTHDDESIDKDFSVAHERFQNPELAFHRSPCDVQLDRTKLSASPQSADVSELLVRDRRGNFRR